MLEVKTERGSNLMLAAWNDFDGVDAACVFEAFVWSGTAFEGLSGFLTREPGSCPP
jgi:hypothetical protein